MSTPPARIARTSLRHALVKSKESTKPVVSWVAVVTVLISALALLGTIFYWTQKTAGHVYREAYLLTFGFQPDAIPWNADDLAVLGYFTQANVLHLLLVAFVIMAVVTSLLMVSANWAARRFAGVQAKKNVPQKRNTKVNLVTTEILICWAIAGMLMGLAYFIALPLALFGQVRAQGFRDAESTIKAIRDWDLQSLKKGHHNFVVIAREKAEPVSGVVISCTEKFCGLYSPVGPAHSHTVPLSDIKSWAKIEWEDVPVDKRRDSSSDRTSNGVRSE